MNRLETAEKSREIGRRPAYPNLNEYRRKLIKAQENKAKTTEK